MRKINGEFAKLLVPDDLQAIKASLDDLEMRALEAGIPLAAYLIGAAAEAISDELVTRPPTLLS